MGGSHLAGVAADWLTSAWGQNAAIYQTAPAAAIAEETAAAWLLDLIDLPRASSVGFATGATMASFAGLAAARGEVLRRAGCDLDAVGLQGAPTIRVFISDEAHASNFAALRLLGFGEANLVRITTDDQGRLDPRALGGAMAVRSGPKIVVCQAGHINSGAFDRFEAIADLTAAHGAWMHVDGAFGLWARAVPELREQCRGVERANSWAVDGHKWLQFPYDSGFAIVRHADAHRRAMDITASYLTEDPRDGRNPTQFGPELSRRARGFVVWAVLQTLGREGVAAMVRRHVDCAGLIADRLVPVPGIRIENDVRLNQVALSFGRSADDPEAGCLTRKVAEGLNAGGRFFVRTAEWRGRTILRLSVTAGATDPTPPPRSPRRSRRRGATSPARPSPNAVLAGPATATSSGPPRLTDAEITPACARTDRSVTAAGHC